MKTLEIDLETRSDRDITKCGVYAYADSPYFAITLMSVAIDDGAVQLYDLANGDRVPEDILTALTDEAVIKRAFNVQFERVCLSRYLREEYPQIFRSYSIDADTVGDYLSPVGWQCTMIHCRTLGLPSTLASAGAALKLEQQKMPEGKALIKYFCVPYDTVDGIPQFHTPADAPDKWETFKAYNKQDVEAELAIDQRLSRFPVPDFIWEQFYLDQEINDRGIRVDMELVEAALTLDAQAKTTLSAEMRRLTGIENPNSVYQLLEWLGEQGYKSDCLDKAAVRELLKTAKDPVKSVLELRLMLSKSSVRKYQAMQTAACSDHRARGMFSFYGASRTGRWAGRIIQLQNLPQNHIPDLTEARNIVKYGYYDEVEMFYEDVPDTLSQLIRTAFVPRPGYKFIVADFWNVIYKVLGSYSGNISADALTVNCKRNVKPEMAELKGKRLIIAAELQEGMRLNTSVVKQLCSTDPIFAEKKFKAPFSFEPSHTLVLYTNHLPKVAASDDGTWRRLIVIPFHAKIQGQADKKNYTQYLIDNAGGSVLSWLIEGAMKVIAADFKVDRPQCVLDAIGAYREGNDWLGSFINDCCEVDKSYMAKSGDLYKEYRDYCTANGEYVRSTTDFYGALEQAGFKHKKTNSGRYIMGLCLRVDFLD